MLILTRKPGPPLLSVPAQHIQGQQVRIGIRADEKFLIFREELGASGFLPTRTGAAGYLWPGRSGRYWRPQGHFFTSFRHKLAHTFGLTVSELLCRMKLKNDSGGRKRHELS